MSNEKRDNKGRYLSLYLSGKIWESLETLKKEGQIISYAEFVRECIKIILQTWKKRRDEI